MTTEKPKVRPQDSLMPGQEPALARQQSDESEGRLRRQRTRSVAIALALGGLVLLFYIATIVRLGGNVFNRPL